MRSRVASENAIETIGSLRKIFYVNAVLLTLGAVGALLSDTAPLIIILAVIQLVFAAVLAFFAYKFTSNPLGFSIAGLILSLIGFGSLFGIIAIVCMIACIVISIRYKKSLEETRRLEAIVQKLKQ